MTAHPNTAQWTREHSEYITLFLIEIETDFTEAFPHSKRVLGPGLSHIGLQRKKLETGEIKERQQRSMQMLFLRIYFIFKIILFYVHSVLLAHIYVHFMCI